MEYRDVERKIYISCICVCVCKNLSVTVPLLYIPSLCPLRELVAMVDLIPRSWYLNSFSLLKGVLVEMTDSRSGAWEAQLESMTSSFTRM